MKPGDLVRIKEYVGAFTDSFCIVIKHNEVNKYPVVVYCKNTTAVLAKYELNLIQEAEDD